MAKPAQLEGPTPTTTDITPTATLTAAEGAAATLPTSTAAHTYRKNFSRHLIQKS